MWLYKNKIVKVTVYCFVVSNMSVAYTENISMNANTPSALLTPDQPTALTETFNLSNSKNKKIFAGHRAIL